LSKTGIGHGKDIAVMMGLSGFDFKTIDIHKVGEYVSDIIDGDCVSQANAANFLNQFRTVSSF